MTSAPNRIGDKVIQQQQHVKLGCVKSQLHCVDDDNDFDDDDVFKVNVNLHTHTRRIGVLFSSSNFFRTQKIIMIKFGATRERFIEQIENRYRINYKIENQIK